MSYRLYITGILSLALITPTLSACATLRPPIETAPPAFIVLEAFPATASLAASTIFKPSTHAVVFDIVEGDNVGEAVKVERSPTREYGAVWADDEADERTEFYRIADNGDVLLTAVIERSDRAITLFDPPLTAVYAALGPGPPLEQVVAMRVMDLKNPQRERESGAATQTITHLGKRRIQTNRGEFVANCVSIKFEARLRLARAVRESTLYVIDGVGLVAAVHEEKITALGIALRNTRQTLVRRDLASVIDAAQENSR